MKASAIPPESSPRWQVRPWMIMVLLALPLRFWGIANGLPDTIHPDETQVVRRAIRFGGGDLNPHFFYWPSLCMYVFFFLYALYYLLGRALGWFAEPMDFAVHFVGRPAPFYLLSRSVMALADSLSAGLLALLAERLFGRRAGIFAALLWVLFPLSPDVCGISRPDSLMVCLSLGALVLLTGRSSPLTSASAGLVLGLAVSAKYNAFLLIPAALAWIAMSGEERLKRSALFLGGTVAGFFAGTPYALPDFGKFINDFLRQAEITRVGLLGAEGVMPRAWLHYLRVLANPVGGFLIAPFAAAGAWLGWRARRREALLLLLALGTVLLSLSIGRTGGERYLYVGFPFLFILAARGMDGAAAVLERRGLPARAAGAVLFLAVAAPYVHGTAVHLRTVSREDTRAQARRWIDAHVPPGSVLLVDGGAPALTMGREQIQDLYERARALGHIKADYFALQLKAHPGGGYRLYLIKQPVMWTIRDHLEYSRQVQDLLPIDRGLEGLRQAGVRYVVVTDQERKILYGDPRIRSLYPAQAAFYDELESRGRPLAEFLGGDRPGPNIRVFEL